MAIEAGIAYSPDGKPASWNGAFSIGDFNRDGSARHIRQDQLRRRHRLTLPQPLATVPSKTITYLSGSRSQHSLSRMGRRASFDMDNDGLARHPHLQRPTSTPRLTVPTIDAPYAETQVPLPATSATASSKRGNNSGRSRHHRTPASRPADAPSATSTTTADHRRRRQLRQQPAPAPAPAIQR